MKPILMLIVLVLLSGCPAGIVPIVGYPQGSTAKAPEVISALPATTGRAEVRLYVQEIDHNYRLLASPDGGRESTPLKQSYRYYVEGRGEQMRELKFLRSDPGIGPLPMPAEYFRKVYPLPTGDGWVAYGVCSGAQVDGDVPLPWAPESPEQKAAAEKRTLRHFIVVFTPDRLRARVEVTTMARRPGIEYRGDLRAVRYRGPSGWMLYLVDENRTKKEPNQTPEPTPPAVTPRADARVAPSSVVAHL